MNFTFYKTLKIALGTMVAIFIAKSLELNYYTSAGIVVILSIQNTRKESLKLAFIRVIASIIALTIAPIVFSMFDYTILSFGIFLLIFVPSSLYFKLQDGIVVNSVLVSHLLVQKSSTFPNLLNELFIMLIGVIIALLFNLYMPSNEITLMKNKKQIENQMKDIIKLMSNSLLEHVVSVREEYLFKQQEDILMKAKEDAYKNVNNNLFLNEDYHVNYVNMRYQQFNQLKRMREHFKHLFITYSVTLYVADFIDKLANSIDEKNNAAPLLEELKKLRLDFKQISLPKTRDEFENRAMLYQFLNDLELFLEIKNEFHLKYD